MNCLKKIKLKSLWNKIMTNYVYENDLPADLTLGDILAIDTETMGLNRFRDRLCVIQISDGDGNAHLVKFLDKNYNAPNLKKLLSDRNKIKIFHFARFDIGTIYYYLNVMIENVYCTKIASKLVRTYTDSHGLKDLCRELLSVSISKEQQSSDWGGLELTESQQNYAASDVLYLHQLKAKLDKMLIRENRLDLAYECFRFLTTRTKLDMLGWETTDIFAHH